MRTLQLHAFFLAVVCLTASGARTASLRELTNGHEGSSTKARTAAWDQEYNNHGRATKEVCLQETNARACGEGLRCGFACPDTSFWTSDFTYCQEGDGGYGSRDAQPLVPPGGDTIGSCDWIWWDRGRQVAAPSKNILKTGTALATCFFAPSNKKCDGPLCGSLAMTLEGTKYSIKEAYSYYDRSSLVCTTGGTRRWQDAFDGAANRTRSTHSAQGAQATGVTAGGDRPQLAQVAYDHGSTHANRDIYVGYAVIISGTITSLTSQRGDRWEGGTFEYTYSFDTERLLDTGIAPDSVWVRGRHGTYQLTFTRSSSKY